VVPTMSEAELSAKIALRFSLIAHPRKDGFPHTVCAGPA